MADSTSNTLLSLLSRKPAARPTTPEEEMELLNQQASILASLKEEKPTTTSDLISQAIAGALPLIGGALAGDRLGLAAGASAGAGAIETYRKRMEDEQERQKTTSLLELANVQNRLDAAALAKQEQAKAEASLAKTRASTMLGQIEAAGGSPEDYLNYVRGQSQRASNVLSAEEAAYMNSVAAQRGLKVEFDPGIPRSVAINVLQNPEAAMKAAPATEEEKTSARIMLQQKKPFIDDKDLYGKLEEQLRDPNMTLGQLDKFTDNIKLIGQSTDRVKELPQARQVVPKRTMEQLAPKFKEKGIELDTESPTTYGELEVMLQGARIGNVGGATSEPIPLSDPSRISLGERVNASDYSAETKQALIQKINSEDFTGADFNRITTQLNQLGGDVERQRRGETARLERVKNRRAVKIPGLTTLDEFVEKTDPNADPDATALLLPVKEQAQSMREGASAWNVLQRDMERMSNFLAKRGGSIPAITGDARKEFKQIRDSIVTRVRLLQKMGANFTPMEANNVYSQMLGMSGLTEEGDIFDTATMINNWSTSPDQTIRLFNEFKTGMEDGYAYGTLLNGYVDQNIRYRPNIVKQFAEDLPARSRNTLLLLGNEEALKAAQSKQK